MNIHVLLSWYDELPGWLDAAIRSLKPLKPHHIICLDGAYATYPRARNRSGIAQYEAITRATHSIGAGLTIHTPATPWAGGEIEKRSYLFQLADQVATPHEDWLMVFDADEQLTDLPDDLHQRLTNTTFDVAEVTFNEPRPGFTTRTYPIPILFRAIPGIQVVANHYTYITPDGRNLWGNAVTDRLEPRIPLLDLEVQHLTRLRPKHRQQAARAYYRDREQVGLEGVRNPGSCCRCPKQATQQVPHNWRLETSGYETTGYVADFVRACDRHAKQIMAENTRLLESMGLNPADFDRTHRWGIRQGPAPAAAA